MSLCVNGYSLDQVETASIPIVGEREFFRLQTEFKQSVSDRYDKHNVHAGVVKHAVDGSIKLIDALALRDLLLSTKPQNILEIGTFLGFSLRWMLDSTASFGPKIVSLDPRVRHRIFDDIKSHVVDFTSGHRHRVTFIDAYLSERNDAFFLHDYLSYEPRMNLAEAEDLLKRIPIIVEPFADFDFAFVDGDHSYNATLANVSLVARMMPSGGYIVVHDAISWPDVRPALEALSAIDGITLVEVLGDDFHRWHSQHHNFRRLDAHVRGSFCDGLGLIKVEAGAAIQPEDIVSLMRTAASQREPETLLRKASRRFSALLKG
jgi:predicted O-methyltransferase YrrM